MLLRIDSKIAVLALLVVISLPALAQRTTGSLKGQVTDPNGAVVVSSKVTATNEDTGVAQSTVTTSSGLYIFPTLLPGNYSVKVEGQGFHDSVKKNVAVTANGERVLDVAMAVGSASETVEVVAGAAAVETATSTVSNTFSSKEVIDIPTGSGNPLQLAIFAPNTTAQQGGIGGVGGSVGGQRPDTNSFSVDGVDDNNVGVTGNNSNVIQDAVAEFNLVTNQFSAEYANAGAGQFNIVTKTGTNNWHGSAQEYLQNRNLNAEDNLTKNAITSGSLDHVPRFDQNIASATIGGPLKRDRWFIFGAFQYTDLHQEGNTTTVSVPTATGLSMLTSMAVDPDAQKLLAVIPTAPAQSQNCGATADQPCNLNVNGSLVPYGTDVLISPNFTRERDFQINSDYRLGKHQFGARYLYNHLTGIQIASTPQSQFNQPETQDARKLSFTDAWAISSNFFNDLRLSYSKYLQVITTQAAFDNYNTIELRDLGGLVIGPSDTQRNLEDNYQILDNQTFARGKHTFKWGAEVRHSIAPSFYLPRSHGDYVYNSTQELVNDLTPGNQGNTLRGAGSPIFSQNQNSIYWFVQDDFKVTSRLTVNLGLRYEFASNFASSKTQEMNALSSVPGVIDFHNPKTDKNNYGPRLGFAWDPTGAGKWAVRGGFGVAYGKVFGNLPQLALPPQLQIEENQGLVCGTFNPAPAWCTNGGTGFLANGGLPATYTLPSDPTLARGLTQGLIADVKNPKTLNWSLGVQRELYRGGVFEARYLGTRGLRLPVQIRLNSEGAFSAGLTPLPTYLDPSQVPVSVNSPASTLATFDGYNPQPLSRYGFLSNVTVHEPVGASTYHGGSLLFTQSLRSGLTLRANYTYAHTIDNSTAELFSTFLNPRRPEDAYNLAGDRGNSALDVRQKLAIAWTYAVPKVKSDNRWMKPFLNGYELNGSFVAQSGQPITVLSPYDANDNFDIAGDRAIINPHGIGNTASDVNAVCNAGPGGATSIVAADPNTGLFSSCGAGDDTNVVGYVAIDPKARYVATQVGSKSTAGRNGFLTPGFGVWNLSATKNTHFTESAYLQLRVELFNAFNHRNFTVAGPVTYSSVLSGQNAVSNPNYNLALPGGDFLNSKLFSGGSRQVQVVMKLIF
jgi:uncharacterized protein YaiE (UPF0345 family)